MAVRRQLMEALRTQDIADLEHAIADATAVLTESAATATGNTSSASSSAMRGGAHQRVVDLDGLLLESKKTFLRLMGHCKHLIKPLRRALRALDGPGIVESLDCIYRSPPAVQKTIEKDTRHAERTVRLMSHAALDAKHMYRTQRWEDVDKFLNLYASVLKEDVVVELTNIRDALLHMTSPNKEPLSPTSSPLSADSVSPSRSPFGCRGASQDSSRIGSSGRSTRAEHHHQNHSPASVEASIVLSPMDHNAVHHHPRQGGMPRGEDAPDVVVPDAEASRRKRVADDELKARVALCRKVLQEKACSLVGQQAMMRRLAALVAAPPTSHASDWSGQYFDSEHATSDHVACRRKYKFLQHPEASEPQRPHVGHGSSTANDCLLTTAATASNVGRAEADARRRLCYYSPSAATTTDSTATSVLPEQRSGAQSPAHSHRGSITALLLQTQSNTTSATTSTAVSRSSSPTPYHPSGELHHERPPLSTRQLRVAALVPQPHTTALPAQLASEVGADEASSRHFIEESEAFNRGVELNPQQARLRLAARTRTQYRVLLTAADESPRSNSSYATVPPTPEPSDGLVHLGRWGMNRDPYTIVDRSPERVENAPGTMRHHEEVLSLKSPSPPNATDDFYE